MSTRHENPAIKIEARALSVAYESFVALRCPELEVSGKIIGIIGHNGAGKSTFIKSLLKILPPTKGTISVTNDGDNLIPEIDMAFCPETGSIFADISVESYIKLWCRIKHHDPKYYRTEGRKYLEQLGLDPLMRKLGRELSKGQRRRVQTAIGFLTNPKLFLFDEPFDGLDVMRTRELADLILTHSEKMAFIISSHRMDVMERIADIIIVLKEGEFVTHGTTEKVCRTLAGKTFLVRSHGKDQELDNVLQAKFPKALVNRIGNQLAITGKELSLEKLNKILSERGIKQDHIEEARPQLIEAMNYYLQS